VLALMFCMALLAADATAPNGGCLGACIRALVSAPLRTDTVFGSSWAFPIWADDDFVLSRRSWLAGLTGRGGESSSSTTSSLGPGRAGVLDLVRRWEEKGLANPHRPQ
jgi:hypothetical protein